MQRPRPLPGGARGGRARRSDDTPELFVVDVVAERAGRGRRPDRATPSSPQRALARLDEHTRAAATDWALGIEARSRALLSEARRGRARSTARRSSGCGATRLRPELARAHLLYGEWLRREGRRVDAREQLRTAHEMFVALGMEAFAERARRELLATGEKVRKRSVETRDELTPQEEQIARLARDGLTNPEIGARLFLSPRTVEWHLRRSSPSSGSARAWVCTMPCPRAAPEPPPRRHPGVDRGCPGASAGAMGPKLCACPLSQ